jgi:hypothetical protein
MSFATLLRRNIVAVHYMTNDPNGHTVSFKRTTVPMDLTKHEAIADKLEEGKLAGWLSDYLVAWHGPSGQLEPNVTVWRTIERSDEEVLRYVVERLTGVVEAQDIAVAGV